MPIQGHVLTGLGILHQEQGRPDEARAHLANGERLLREVGDPVELAKLLCTRARLATGPDSTLVRALAKARPALESPCSAGAADRLRLPRPVRSAVAFMGTTDPWARRLCQGAAAPPGSMSRTFGK